MKKIVCAIAVLILLLALASCEWPGEPLMSDIPHEEDPTGIPEEDDVYRADINDMSEFYRHLMMAAAEGHSHVIFQLNLPAPVSVDAVWQDHAVRFVGNSIQYFVLFGDDGDTFRDQTLMVELPERPAKQERKHAPSAEDYRYPKWRNAVTILRRRAIEASPHKRDENFNDFAIQQVNEGSLPVHDTEQLWIALEKNFLPIFEQGMSSMAERVWHQAKVILREIITEDMNELQKLRAIYDFLCEEVDYDHELAAISGPHREDASHFPEGVLQYGYAVCDGIAKTAVILCRMEGIPCVLIEGKGEHYGHAWNAVEYEGNWYTFCATYGMMSVSDTTLLAQALDGPLSWTSYRTFMAPLSYMDALYPEQSCGDLPPVADRTVSLDYPTQYPDFPGAVTDLHIETVAELEALFAELVNSGVEGPYFMELTTDVLWLDLDLVAQAAHRSDPFASLLLYRHHDEMGLTRYTVFVR